MNIGIITQPLTNNYGGLLQNWALQQILIRAGHNPITLDLLIKRYPTVLQLNIQLKNIAKNILSRLTKRNFSKGILTPMNRSDMSNRFIIEHINTTERLDKYDMSTFNRYGLDGLIVGSDQVWRPIYNLFLKDMFLEFCKRSKFKKIAYAASFGVDKWELTKSQTKRAKQLVLKFDAISVRESSAVDLLAEYLGCNAQLVLDPTLLLRAEDYYTLLDKTPKSPSTKYVATYLLDRTLDCEKLLNDIAKLHDAKVIEFSADNAMSLSVGEWLSTIKNAKHVITDSFHGMVFSILFRRDFHVLINETRGASRFKSLLNNLGLSTRLITVHDGVFLQDMTPIQWDSVYSRLYKLRKSSLNFLAESLR